jgi:GNAT superfamily N-acetyltransferase
VFTDYLQRQASQDLRRRAARVVVMRDAESRIAGYYTIAATGVALTSLSPAMQKRLPRYPVVPAVLIGRLALDSRYEGQGLGATLLVHAIERASRLDGAVWCVVVDAIDEAAARFYEHLGFVRLPDTVDRLVLPIETYLKARENPAP